MPEIPQEAVQAAADAISRKLFSGQPEWGTWMEHDEDLGRAAVEAAAPLVAAAERARIVSSLRSNAEQVLAARTAQKTLGAIWDCDVTAGFLEQVAHAIERGGHA